MRLVSGLLNAGLVALGISLLIRYYPRRTPPIGVLIALSPMVLFLMSVVSSSGLEIASGFSTWCGALCIVEHTLLPRALAIWTAFAAVVLVLSRPTSPLDAVVITIVLALLIGWHGLRQRLNPSLVPLWSPVLVALIVAGGFLVVFGGPHLTVPHRPIQPASCPTCGRTYGSPGFGSASASGTLDGSTRRSRPGSSSRGPRASLD
jgi:hypothetical protein